MARNPPWNRDELILALDLYVRHGWLDDRHPEVIELSHVLNRLTQSAPSPTFRNPNGVPMKLANFAGIDPNHAGVGLRGAGRNDRRVWEEFATDPDRLARTAAAIRIRLLDDEPEGPEANPELADAEDAIAEIAGRRPVGQGFRVSAEGRRALEEYAMGLAEQYYRSHGWDVENVSARASYDLRCTRVGRAELHVEVKGTQSDGRKILLTRNEVRHVRATYPNTALFVVARIQLSRDEQGAIGARGGVTIVQEPWTLKEDGLSPLAYEYRVT